MRQDFTRVGYWLVITSLFLSTVGLGQSQQARANIKCDQDGQEIYIDGEFKASCDKGTLVSIYLLPGEHALEAKKTNEDGSYYFYKKKFRIMSGVITNIEVRSKIEYTENYYWGRCKTIEGCWTYLEKFPDGAYSVQAKERLDELYFAQCTSIEGCKNYLRNSPIKTRVDEALRKIDEFYWDECSNASGCYRYLTELKDKTWAKHIEEAEDRYYQYLCEGNSTYACLRIEDYDRAIRAVQNDVKAINFKIVYFDRFKFPIEASFSSDSKYLAYGGGPLVLSTSETRDTKYVKIIGTDGDWLQRRVLVKDESDASNDFKFSPDGEYLIMTNTKRLGFRVYAAPEWKEVAAKSLKVYLARRHLMFSPSGKYLLLVGDDPFGVFSNYTELHVYNVTDWTHYPQSVKSKRGLFAFLAPHKDQLVVLNKDDDRMTIYELPELKESITVNNPVNKADFARFSIDGKYLGVTTFSNGNKVLHIYSSQNSGWERIQTIPFYKGEDRFQFSLNGEYIYILHCDGRLEKRSLRGSYRLHKDLGAKTVCRIDISPDGKYLVIPMKYVYDSKKKDVRKYILHIISTSDLEIEKTIAFTAKDGYDSCRYKFSPDGKYLATYIGASESVPVIRVYDTKKWDLIFEHEYPVEVLGVVFAPNSRFMVTTHAKGAMFLHYISNHSSNCQTYVPNLVSAKRLIDLNIYVPVALYTCPDTGTAYYIVDIILSNINERVLSNLHDYRLSLSIYNEAGNRIARSKISLNSTGDTFLSNKMPKAGDVVPVLFEMTMSDVEKLIRNPHLPKLSFSTIPSVEFPISDQYIEMVLLNP